MSRSATIETLRDLSSALWTIRSNQQATRVLRTTNSLLRCFLFFDICYLMSGIALVTMALTSEIDSPNRDKMIMFGGLFGFFASISTICNRLANHGMKTWRRSFLLPWMAFYWVVLVLMLMQLGHSLYFQQAQWRHVFIFIANIAVFSCWRHMQKQFLLMALPKPQSVVFDVEAVVREYLSPGTSFSPLADLPPKYEDVEGCPPQYNEQTMLTPNSQDNENRASGDNTTVQNEQA